MALSEYMELGINDNPVRTFGDPAYINLSIANVVKNLYISLKTTLKKANTGDIVSDDSNLYIYD